MSTASIAPGMYGKLPAVGDFVSRRLTSGFVSTWDAWIQEAFTCSRQQLDSDWLDVYLTSPIWRFILTAGSCGEKASAGILMPSVDKVGRYFPLTLAALLEDRIDLPFLFTLRTGWFASLEALALTALEDSCELEDFDHRLQQLHIALPIPADCDQANASEPVEDGTAPIRIEMNTLEHLPQAFNQLTVVMLNRQFTPYSMWSTDGSDLLNPSLMIYSGLPPAAEFAGFLTGDWERFGEGRPISVSASLIHTESAGEEAVNPDTNGAATTSIRWQSCGISHVGKIRSINEDAFIEKPQDGIWAVADGMGGHLSGDEASRAIVEGLSAVTATDTIDRLIVDVSDCLQTINANLLKRSRNQQTGQIMGSTVVVMLAAGNRCAALWAGDSRLYRYRDGRLSQLTRDHSPNSEQENPDAAAPTKENNSNVVTRALGGDQDLLLDKIAFEAMPGDRYLLCSDGLVKAASADDIEAGLCRSDPEACSRDLIDRALKNNARDNVTVIVINPV